MKVVKSKNTEVEDVQEVIDETVATKVEKLLGGDINDTSLEELKQSFDTVTGELIKRQYSTTLSEEQVTFMWESFLPSIEYVGKQCFDIDEINKMVVEIGDNRVITSSKEKISVLFNYILMHKMKGVDDLYKVKSLLLSLSKVVEEINIDNQKMKDAGFELQAAELGITPEKHYDNVSKMNNAAAVENAQ